MTALAAQTQGAVLSHPSPAGTILCAVALPDLPYVLISITAHAPTAPLPARASLTCWRCGAAGCN